MRIIPQNTQICIFMLSMLCALTKDKVNKFSVGIYISKSPYKYTQTWYTNTKANRKIYIWNNLLLFTTT